MMTLEYLDEERKKLWEKVVQLEQDLNARTPEYESEAKQSSKKASEYKNRSEESKNAIAHILDESRSKQEEIKSIHAAVLESKTQIESLFNNSSANSSTIHETLEAIQKQKESVQSYVDELEAIFEQHDTFVEKLKKLETIFAKSDESATKIDSIYSLLSSRKKEIDTLYYEIVGYTETDEKTGTEEKVEGLKDELENSYSTIKANLAELEKEISEVKSRATSEFSTFIQEKESKFSAASSQWVTEFDQVSKKLNELLPNALTAGLSYAYSEKKKVELEEYSKLEKTFNYGIYGLIAVSLIPFAISIYSLFHGDTLVEVLLRMPRLVLSILPLYVPVLWVAHSANRKMNLSKRLTEEYTHKEVLSKTFEGLAKQISDVQDKNISSDLRIRLLYNILEVNSENPGKLISDYNKSDHPLMDALDKSAKLATAVDKLAKIPGFTKLSDTLSKKSVMIAEEAMQKANKGLEILSETESKSDKS